MGAKYEPRDLEDAQKNYKVLLEVKPGVGAYGFGETLEEAVKNANYYLRRDFGPTRKVRQTKALTWDQAERRWVELPLVDGPYGVCHGPVQKV